MAKYDIQVTETVNKSLRIEADSKEVAMQIARERFENGEIVMSKENDNYDFDISAYKRTD